VTDGPLIVQSDKTLLLEVEHPQYHEARAAIAPFAELERSPEHVHTYRLTPLGLWNARAAGHDAEQVVDALVRFSRYTVPHALLVDVADTMDRYGRLQLMKHPTHGLVLVSLDRAVLEEVLRQKKITPMLGDRVDPDMVLVHPSERGRLKQALLKVGWPAEDLAGYVDGEAHPIELDNTNWTLRHYQQDAVDSFLGRWLRRGGFALWCRQDPGWCGRDGTGQGHHAHPRDQHGQRSAMEAGTARANLAHRRGDRRILR